ncbi:APC family permease [Papillibacter cinnamivorans]|uniref:Amino acid/polyamine/organocation transporter, APC superfamily n=1 Tax=Papillibacter cinnamivorans DSM 12816 TaxID=1122930 RepID=A0A1W2ATG9_9FIRM|nr:APC family permease [Papillibacter cinnamivorans]SMC63884.1 amino acid/polyamine/organocation transporter, APC superfamily [Papillibacter cinnamivorans DSM 12816]
MEKKGLERNIGVIGGSAILIGYVIGASIFVLPGTVAAEVGPSVWLSYIIASIMAILSALIAAGMSGVLAVPGASAEFVRRTWGEKMSLAYGICYLFIACLSLALVAYGMAYYVQALFPGVSIIAVALVALVITGVFNLSGNKVLTAIQTASVGLLVVGIAVFVLGSVPHIDVSNLTPMFPVGVFPVIAASVTLSFSYAGFTALVDLGGEIKNPAKSLPRILVISVAVVTVLYVFISLAMVGTVPYAELGNGAPAYLVATRFLPPGFDVAITLVAIIGSYTTLFALIQANSRILYNLSENGYFPSVFTKLSKNGIPYNGVVLITIVAIIMLVLLTSLIQYANIIVFLLVGFYVLYAVGMLRIKTKMPEEYKNATFKFSGAGFYIWPVALIVGSVLYAIVVAKSDTQALIVGVVAAVVIYAVSALIIARKKKSARDTAKDKV